MVEKALYLGQKLLLLFFILNSFVAFKKTKPRHHSCALHQVELKFQWNNVNANFGECRRGNIIFRSILECC